MTTKPNGGSPESLDDVMDRCVIDEDTGCWLWGGYYHKAANSDPVPTTFVRKHVLDDGRHKVPVRELALFFAKRRRLEQGQRTYAVVCGNKKCVNPDHAGVGKQTDLLAAHKRASDKQAPMNPPKAKPSKPIDAESAKRAEAMLRAGKSIAQVHKELGLNHHTLRHIRNGLELRQVGGKILARGASIFALAASQ